MSRKMRKLIWSVPLGGGLSCRRRSGHVCGAGARERVCQPVARRADATWTVERRPRATMAKTGRTTLVLTWDAPAGGRRHRLPHRQVRKTELRLGNHSRGHRR